MMTDQEIRLECLRLALDSTDDTEGAIEIARQYEAFVIGGAEGQSACDETGGQASVRLTTNQTDGTVKISGDREVSQPGSALAPRKP